MGDRPAQLSDVHEIAAGMPHTKRIEGPKGNAIYQVGGKSFVFFRTPQPDAADPETGERFDDHPSVLIRAARLADVSKTELAELIQDGWLSRASKRRAEQWIAAHR